MVKRAYYKQNDGKLPKDAPKYLGAQAAIVWRKIVPFLESTNRVQRIDASLVEQYCTQYEIYRIAYDDVKENGIQTKLFKSLQNSAGKIIGKDFTGFRKNPAVATMKDAISQLNAIGRQLGLTPLGRQELMELANSKKEKSTAELLKESGLV